MLSNIQTLGYGYRKQLCEDVTTWFLNKFFPRHKLYIEIVHRGLKREHILGVCDVLGATYRPREFIIELQAHMPQEQYIQTLLHELTHVRQWVIGSLKLKSGKMYYGSKNVEDYEYWYQPHEIEAREQEETLYYEYLRSKSVPKFSNRLMQNG
jgi:hypothetical protein